jgi:hypothetical protein
MSHPPLVNALARFFSNRKLLIASICVIASLTVYSIFKQSPGVYFDPACGLIAMEHYLQGKSENIRTIQHPDSQNLNNDVSILISNWPPAQQGIPFIFRKMGFDLGLSIKTTVFLAWSIGLLGWACYFKRFLSPIKTGWLLVFFMMFRYSHSNSHMYDGGEVLLWSAFPWAVLISIRGVESQTGWPILVGFFVSLLSFIKYSSALLIMGIWLVWLLMAWNKKIKFWKLAAFTLGLCLGGLLLKCLNIPGGSTPATASHFSIRISKMLFPITAIPWAVSDLDSLINYLFFKPNSTPIISKEFLIIPGLLFLVLCTILIRQTQTLKEFPATTSKPIDSFLKSLILACPILTAIILAILIAGGSAIGSDPHHMRSASLLLLPVIFSAILSSFTREGRRIRLLGFVLLTGLFLIPALYGSLTFIEKTWKRSARLKSQAGFSGIRYDVLGADVDAKAFYKEVEFLTGFQASNRPILYITSPTFSFDFSSWRLIIEGADFLRIEDLARERRGFPVAGIFLLLPDYFETNGKAQAIRTAFLDVERWERIQLTTNPNFGLWHGIKAD